MGVENRRFKVGSIVTFEASVVDEGSIEGNEKQLSQLVERAMNACEKSEGGEDDKRRTLVLIEGQKYPLRILLPDNSLIIRLNTPDLGAGSDFEDVELRFDQIEGGVGVHFKVSDPEEQERAVQPLEDYSRFLQILEKRWLDKRSEEFDSEGPWFEGDLASFDFVY